MSNSNKSPKTYYQEKLNNINLEYNQNIEEKNNIEANYKNLKEKYQEIIDNFLDENNILNIKKTKYLNLIDNKNKELEKIKDEKENSVFKEKKIFSNEQKRICEKKIIITESYNKNIEYNNNILHHINLNRESLNERILFLKKRKESNSVSKLAHRQNIETSINEYNNSIKLKKKHILLYKSNIVKCNEKIKFLNEKFQHNLQLKNKANKVFYSIKEELEELNKKMDINQKEMNDILEYSPNISISNIINNDDLSIPSSIKNISFSNKESLIVEKVKYKEKIEERIKELLDKPEYDLKKFYNTIEEDNNKILNEIISIDNNKKQLELLIKNNKKKSELPKVNDESNKEKTKKYMNEILKLKKRLVKSKADIDYIKEDNQYLTEQFNNLISKEDAYDLKSKKRLSIVTSRIDETYKTKFNNIIASINITTENINSVNETLEDNKRNIKNYNFEINKITKEYNTNMSNINSLLENIKNKSLKFKKLLNNSY